MILELSNGRELKLPDEMDDDTARMIGKLILTLEKRAEDAENDVKALRGEMAALRDEVQARPVAEPQEKDTSEADAIRALRADLNKGIKQLIQAQLADRVMMADEFGEMTKSRAVLR